MDWRDDEQIANLRRDDRGGERRRKEKKEIDYNRDNNGFRGTYYGDARRGYAGKNDEYRERPTRKEIKSSKSSRDLNDEIPTEKGNYADSHSPSIERHNNNNDNSNNNNNKNNNNNNNNNNDNDYDNDNNNNNNKFNNDFHNNNINNNNNNNNNIEISNNINSNENTLNSSRSLDFLSSKILGADHEGHYYCSIDQNGNLKKMSIDSNYEYFEDDVNDDASQHLLYSSLQGYDVDDVRQTYQSQREPFEKAKNHLLQKETSVNEILISEVLNLTDSLILHVDKDIKNDDANTLPEILEEISRKAIKDAHTETERRKIAANVKFEAVFDKYGFDKAFVEDDGDYEECYYDDMAPFLPINITQPPPKKKGKTKKEADVKLETEGITNGYITTAENKNTVNNGEHNNTNIYNNNSTSDNNNDNNNNNNNNNSNNYSIEADSDSDETTANEYRNKDFDVHALDCDDNSQSDEGDDVKTQVNRLLDGLFSMRFDDIYESGSVASSIHDYEDGDFVNSSLIYADLPLNLDQKDSSENKKKRSSWVKTRLTHKSYNGRVSLTLQPVTNKVRFISNGCTPECEYAEVLDLIQKNVYFEDTNLIQSPPLPPRSDPPVLTTSLDSFDQSQTDDTFTRKASIPSSFNLRPVSQPHDEPVAPPRNKSFKKKLKFNVIANTVASLSKEENDEERIGTQIPLSENSLNISKESDEEEMATFKSAKKNQKGSILNGFIPIKELQFSNPVKAKLGFNIKGSFYQVDENRDDYSKIASQFPQNNNLATTTSNFNSAIQNMGTTHAVFKVKFKIDERDPVTTSLIMVSTSTTCRNLIYQLADEKGFHPTNCHLFLVDSVILPIPRNEMLLNCISITQDSILVLRKMPSNYSPVAFDSLHLKGKLEKIPKSINPNRGSDFLKLRDFDAVAHIENETIY
eukprot:Awhi_evm1s10900